MGLFDFEFKMDDIKKHQQDTDARWITKNIERHFGYKNHINADKKTNS